MHVQTRIELMKSTGLAGVLIAFARQLGLLWPVRSVVRESPAFETGVVVRVRANEVVPTFSATETDCGMTPIVVIDNRIPALLTDGRVRNAVMIAPFQLLSLFRGALLPEILPLHQLTADLLAIATAPAKISRAPGFSQGARIHVEGFSTSFAGTEFTRAWPVHSGRVASYPCALAGTPAALLDFIASNVKGFAAPFALFLHACAPALNAAMGKRWYSNFAQTSLAYAPRKRFATSNTLKLYLRHSLDYTTIGQLT